MASIYRKYRPKTFAEMVGQNHIKLTLQNELETESFVHAYLFCGPRGLGKTTAARLFAKAVNCQNRKKGQSEPCNECDSCLEIMEGRAMDLIEIDAASHTGVDNVRENIIENVRFSPNKSKFKVFIIDEVHMLSISAFNALLKTLEEPPAHAIFVLCTTEIHKVPDTIISRCQRFDFKKVGVKEIIKRLEKIADNEQVKIDDQVFEIIAGKSEGCIRDADGLLGQVLSLGGKKITKEQVSLILPSSEIGLIVEFVNLLVAKKSSQALEMVNNLVDDGVDLEVFVKQAIEFLRKLLLIKSEVAKGELFGMTKEIHQEAERILEYVSLIKLAELIQILLVVVRELKNSEIVQLPMELAIIKICGEDESAGEMPKFTPHQKNDFSEGHAPIKKEVEQKVEIVKEESQPVKTKKTTASKIDFEKIKSNWVKIIRQSHQKNRDLMFINQNMVWPVKVDGSDLVIGFKFDIHKTRFEKNGNQEIFAGVVKDAVGEDVVVKAKTLKSSEVVDFEIAEENNRPDEKLSGVKVTEENILDQVLDSFGGEVVEFEG